MSKNKKWDEDSERVLKSIVGGESPVSNETVDRAAEQLERTPRSISAKLRNLGLTVDARVSAAREKTFSDAQQSELRNFVENNSGKYTYSEIAEALFGGSKTSKQIQGKILSMELFSHVKATPQVEVPKKYTEAEEATFVKLAEQGKYIEDIAKALGKTVQSVAGKALSLNRTKGLAIPARDPANKAPEKVDPIDALGDISNRTVESIAEEIGKSARGVKTMLTHRGKDCSDYKGSTKRAKADEKKSD